MFVLRCWVVFRMMIEVVGESLEDLVGVFWCYGRVLEGGDFGLESGILIGF